MLKLILKFLNFLGKIPILKEFEWFEWFGPSPIEPFNSGIYRVGRPRVYGGRGERPAGRAELLAN